MVSSSVPKITIVRPVLKGVEASKSPDLAPSFALTFSKRFCPLRMVSPETGLKAERWNGQPALGGSGFRGWIGSYDHKRFCPLKFWGRVPSPGGVCCVPGPKPEIYMAIGGARPGKWQIAGGPCIRGTRMTALNLPFGRSQNFPYLDLTCNF